MYSTCAFRWESLMRHQGVQLPGWLGVLGQRQFAPGYVLRQYALMVSVVEEMLCSAVTSSDQLLEFATNSSEPSCRCGC